MNFKKRVNGSWVDTPNYIHKTDTDTFTALPAVLYPTGTTATVGLKGNTVQSGTPTPDSPIMPQGTGERTGNLVRFYQEEMQDTFYGVDITVKNAEITLNGTVTVGAGHWVEIGYKFGGGTESTDNVVIPCEPETSYTITTEILDGDSSAVRPIAFGTSNENRIVNIGSSLTTMFSADINHIFISLGVGGVVFNNLKFRVMFNKGSTALPYEPYGYKIPISNGQQTTNIYLGSTQTVRQIKKVVLTGNESGWAMSGTRFYNVTLPDNPKEMFTVISTHFTTTTNPSSVEIGCIRFAGTVQSPTQPLIFNYDNGAIGLVAFKQWVADQYAAGTPVTVWYVLANPETAVVNEPLMKIGEHADTVSGITIPTITSKDTFDVDTTLKPSEVSLSYTGWHNAKCKEYSYNMTIADWESASISQMEDHTIQELQGGNWV